MFFSLTEIYYNINYLKEIKGQTLDHFINYKILKNSHVVLFIPFFIYILEYTSLANFTYLLHMLISLLGK